MSLSLEQLRVTSFETVSHVAPQVLPNSLGEDCFSRMPGCPPVTITG